MGLIAVPDDKIATIVTTLEMRAPPPRRPMPPTMLRLVAWPHPPRDRYRALFRRVGAPWLWYSRLVMADATLDALLADPEVAVFAAVDRGGVEVGMLELDWRVEGRCTIAYFALVPEWTGRGHGRWLMAEAMVRAWRPGVAAVTVHTCTLDHPRALGFYRTAGFAATARRVETFADPRVAGVLPADAAPQIPLIASRR